MYEALCDLVDLLKHTDLEVLAAVCRLIENVASFEDNLKTMIDVGVIDNLANLVTTVNIFLYRRNYAVFIYRYIKMEYYIMNAHQQLII